MAVGLEEIDADIGLEPFGVDWAALGVDHRVVPPGDRLLLVQHLAHAMVERVLHELALAHDRGRFADQPA